MEHSINAGMMGWTDLPLLVRSFQPSPIKACVLMAESVCLYWAGT